jgi:hypothetical protein
MAVKLSALRTGRRKYTKVCDTIVMGGLTARIELLIIL